MGRLRSLARPHALPIRGVFWALLAAALLLALAAPAVNLWRQARTGLVIDACVWPRIPRVGVPAHLLVTVPNAADRAAVHGPWARVEADWDMVTMSMGAQRTILSGASTLPGSNTALSVPLRLTMGGLWSARLVVVIPGRPQWQRTLHFAVASAEDAPAPLPTDQASLPACQTG